MRGLFARHAILPEISAKTKRIHCSLVACVSAGALLAGASAADGLVIESSASAYIARDVIKSGDHVSLQDGERLVVLDQSGVVQTLTESLIYDDGRATPMRSQSVSAVDAAVWSGQRPVVGGTRTTELEECLEVAVVRDDLDEADCRLANPATDNSLQFQAQLAVRAVSLRPGDPLMIKLESNFEAIATCTAAPAGGDNAPERLSLAAGAGVLHLRQGVVAMAPQRGSPRLVAPELPGDYVVTCEAVDVSLWSAFSDASSEISLDYLSGFAELRGAPALSSTIDVRVVD